MATISLETFIAEVYSKARKAGLDISTITDNECANEYEKSIDPTTGIFNSQDCEYAARRLVNVCKYIHSYFSSYPCAITHREHKKNKNKHI